MIEYTLIKNFYGDNKAKRSGVLLMNHIDEGLIILDKINASFIAKKAYCLHPIIQSDEAVVKTVDTKFLRNDIDANVIITAMEYRSVANDYLSTRTITDINEIKLSPLKDVNDMLIADKIQNRKDFEMYHIRTHPRSEELCRYFENWFVRLGITHDLYSDCLNIL